MSAVAKIQQTASSGAEWPSTTLKDAAKELFTDGDWVESKDQDPDGEVRLIQLADIGDGTFLDKSARFLTADKARELRCTFLEPGDLLIARMADPIARCCLFPGIDQPAATVVDVSIVRPGPDVDREYLAYAISNPAFRSEALGSASGTTRSRISRSNLGAISLPLPPLDEQRRIAEVLRSVDEAIAANQDALDFCANLLAVKRRAAFRHLLIDPDSASYRLGDICDLGRGFAFKSEDYINDGVLNFRVTNVGRPLSDLGERRFLPDSFMDEYDEYVLSGGEIVLVMVGATVGKLGRVPVDVCPALLNQNMWTLIAKPPFEPDLLWHLAHVLIEEKVHGAQGGAYSFLTKKDFLQHRISRFDLGEMAGVVAHLSALESYIEHLAEEVRQQHQIKQALMSDLLSGRVRVPA